MDHLYAVIMAGGSGTRFWPFSRNNRPKQLLRLTGGARTLLGDTYDRLEGLVLPGHVLVATNERLVDQIRDELPELALGSVIGEPCKRDTAPCIGLTAMQVFRDNPDAVMIVMPADHVIRPAEIFRDNIRSAVGFVEEDPTRIVTFGIRPDYPAQNYGYIHRGKPVATTDGQPTCKAFASLGFREKPDADTAQEYLESGEYYWNGGIFVWSARFILEQLEKFAPQMYAHLQMIEDAAGSPDAEDVFRREFEAIRGTSIDYAVMEHTDNVLVIEADFNWDDVGGWQSLARLLGTDENDNASSARSIHIDSHGCIVASEEKDHAITLLGMKDCIVVHTPDATLVANKHDEESVRQVVKELESRGWDHLL